MPTAPMRSLRALLVAMLFAAAGVTPAAAHPHVWITVEVTVLHDKGAFVGLKHKWTFDEFYTAMAIEGLDKNKDGKYDREELAELAKVNLEGLKDFAYFTFPKLQGQELKVADVRDYWLEHSDGILSLHFTLPFEQPVLVEAKGMTLSVTDPTYFIAFELAKADPVKLAEGAPKTCKVSVGAQSQGQEQGNPSALGAPPSAPPQLGAFAVSFIKTVSIDCNGP